MEMNGTYILAHCQTCGTEHLDLLPTKFLTPERRYYLSFCHVCNKFLFFPSKQIFRLKAYSIS